MCGVGLHRGSAPQSFACLVLPGIRPDCCASLCRSVTLLVPPARVCAHCSSVAQWQSIRLLTGGLLVRVQPEEPISESRTNPPWSQAVASSIGQHLVSQRRHVNRKRPQSITYVTAKSSVVRCCPEIAVRRRKHARRCSVGDLSRRAGNFLSRMTRSRTICVLPAVRRLRRE